MKNIFKVFLDPPLSQLSPYFFTKLHKSFVSICCLYFLISILSSTYSNLIFVPTILLKMPCPGHYILHLAKSNAIFLSSSSPLSSIQHWLTSHSFPMCQLPSLFSSFRIHAYAPGAHLFHKPCLNTTILFPLNHKPREDR